MSGRDTFAAVVFALAAIGAVRVVKMVFRSLKSTIRALGATLQAIGEKLATDERNDSDEESEPSPRVNRRVRAPKQAMPRITDDEIAAFLARKASATQAAKGN